MPFLSIRQIVSGVGLMLTFVTATALPVGYAVVSYESEAEAVLARAKLNAGYVERYAYQTGEMWTFHKVRLAEIIEINKAKELNSRRYRILAADGRLILEEGGAPKSPAIVREDAIVVRGVVIGRVEVEASARPLLIITGLLAILSLCLASVVYYVVRLLPVRLLDRTVEALEAKADVALNSMSQGLAMFDAEQRLVVCNRRYVEMYELPPDVMKSGATLREILEHRVAAGLYAGESPEAYIAERLAADRGEPGTSFTTMKDGRVLALVNQPLVDGGWVGTHEDITDRKRAEAQIAHMAHHDALTGLPNRLLFHEEMERGLTRVRRGGKLAVLCLDLDHFKAVNDTLGHPIGDALLKVVAERLRGCLKETDTVARLGGDEFAIVQAAIEHADEATKLAQRVIDAISSPFDLDGHLVMVGTSVGIALAPMDGDDSNYLLKCADMALYRAKADGRGRFHFFEAEMDARMQARRALELDLRKALGAGEFDVFYQPVVCLRTDKVISFEALLRWRHPERGMVPPAEFIPLAEEIGVIGQIGAWVLKRACSDAMTWPGEVGLAVNLSPAQFKTGTLVLEVMAALGHSGLSARRLELEITETVLLQVTEGTLATLNQLRDLGIRIAMDDFGTGYSSLSYLRKFPFDKIKIDQSFVRDLMDKGDSTAIVRAVAGLGISLGMATTAEGVETEAQLAKLRVEGCTEVQGYLFSRPMPASEVSGMIASVEGRKSDAA